MRIYENQPGGKHAGKNCGGINWEMKAKGRW
jgi:hypothetical protein